MVRILHLCLILFLAEWQKEINARLMDLYKLLLTSMVWIKTISFEYFKCFYWFTIMKENVSIVLGIFSIIVAIAIYYRQKSEGRSISNFFIFISLSEQRVSQLARRLSILFFGIIVITYLFSFIVGALKLPIISNTAIKQIETMSLLAQSLALMAQTIANQILVNKSNKRIDKLIDKGKSRLRDYKDNVDIISLTLFLVLPTAAIIFGLGLLTLFGTILLVCVIQSVFCSYLDAYFVLWRKFHVKKMSVISNNAVYEEVYGYTISKGMITLICLDNRELKQIDIPLKELLRIESIVDLTYRRYDFLNNQTEAKIEAK